MHDLLLRTAISGELTEIRDSQMPSKQAEFQHIQRYAKTTEPFYYDAMDLTEGSLDNDDLSKWLLAHLKAGDDHATLYWATEYLSVNIATHYTCTLWAGRENWKLMESSWPEVDGSLPTIEYHAMHQNRALDGVVDPLYFRHPWKPHKLMDRETAKRCLDRSRDFLEGILTPEQRTNYSNITDLELKQLVYLCLAMKSWRLGNVDHHNTWSANLLSRYLMVTGHWRRSDFLHVSIEDLRRVLRTILMVLASREDRDLYGIPRHVHTNAPAGFDNELFHPFAGQYSSLLERAWREYMAIPDADAMDLG